MTDGMNHGRVTLECHNSAGVRWKAAIAGTINHTSVCFDAASLPGVISHADVTFAVFTLLTDQNRKLWRV